MGVAQPTRYEPGVRVYVDVVGVLATACASQNMDMLLQNILGCIPSKKDEMAHANKDRAWPSQHGMSRACAFARTRWASLHLHGRVQTCAVIMVDSYSGSTRPSSSMFQLQCTFKFQYTFKTWQHIVDAVAAAAVVTTTPAGGCQVNGV